MTANDVLSKRSTHFEVELDSFDVAPWTAMMNNFGLSQAVVRPSYGDDGSVLDISAASSHLSRKIRAGTSCTPRAKSRHA